VIRNRVGAEGRNNANIVCTYELKKWLKLWEKKDKSQVCSYLKEGIIPCLNVGVGDLWEPS
jgi:hypothetical protein